MRHTKGASHIVCVLCIKCMYIFMKIRNKVFTILNGAYHSASCVFLLQLALHLSRVGVVGALALVVWQADHLFGL